MMAGMRLRSVTIVSLSFLAGCSSGTSTPDVGIPDAGAFAIAGTVQIHPVAARWLKDNQKAEPSLDELILRFSDPFVAQEEPATQGLLGTDGDIITCTADGGTFSAPGLKGLVVLGVAAEVADLRPPLDEPRLAPDGSVGEPPGRVVIPTRTLILAGTPHDVTDAVAYALPTDFVHALETALGEPDLEVNGFLLGIVLDKDGNPVRGATVTGHAPFDDTRVRFLDADLKALPGTTMTGVTGAFLVAGAVEAVNLSVPDAGCGQQKALATPRRAFLLVFRMH